MQQFFRNLFWALSLSSFTKVRADGNFAVFPKGPDEEAANQMEKYAINSFWDIYFGIQVQFWIQSQELGQMAILPLPHGALMRTQQMSLPGLARLGLMQWAEGQDGEFWARDFSFKNPMPVTAERKVKGCPSLALEGQLPTLQQV